VKTGVNKNSWITSQKIDFSQKEAVLSLLIQSAKAPNKSEIFPKELQSLIRASLRGMAKARLTALFVAARHICPCDSYHKFFTIDKKNIGIKDEKKVENTHGQEK
jgi:hypothetical protein